MPPVSAARRYEPSEWWAHLDGALGERVSIAPKLPIDMG